MAEAAQKIGAGRHAFSVSTVVERANRGGHNTINKEKIKMPDELAPFRPPIDPITELKENVAKIKQEVDDALKIASNQRDRQWFRSPSILISLLALLFSFGTTAVSFIRTNKQDVHDARSELRNLIQRLDQIPRENVEYQTKYANDPLVQNQVSALLNSENAMVTKDAADVIDRIPNNVSATEYLAVARALSNSALTDRALKFAKRGLDVSSDVNDEVDLDRFYAGLLFSVGNAEQGRTQYK
ncbi:MAG: hypothetical protein ACREDD_13045, partial [Methylocella sp.]